MPAKQDNPFQTIKGVFHEPNRLAILSSLCNAENGLSFNELREECELTDGNLSRHLKALEEARVIRIRKTFAKSRPLTTVYITERGRERFVEYLQALEEVLVKAAEAIKTEERKPASLLPFGKTMKA
jgi:DNA-binding HxlR family transcriptional regulator